METTRRNFLKTVSIGGAIAFYPRFLQCKNLTNNDIQLFDYHVHIEQDITIESATANFKERKMKFGILEHPGPRYSKMVNDDLLLEYIRKYEPYDVFVGLQPVDPGWHKQFSPEVIDKVDYIVMDALEIPTGKGDFERIWEQRFVMYNKSTFMDRYVDFHLEIIENEKINILANPTFLPTCLAPEYYKLWTEKYMDAVIRYAVKNKIAFEINSVYQYPKAPFIKMAKEAGAKFAFGSNGHSMRELKNYDYCLEMIEECRLTNDDIFKIDKK